MSECVTCIISAGYPCFERYRWGCNTHVSLGRFEVHGLPASRLTSDRLVPHPHTNFHIHYNVVVVVELPVYLF